MNLQEKYDELSEVIEWLQMIENNLNDKYYVERIKDVKNEMQNELDSITEELQEEEDKELRRREIEYMEAVL